MTTGILLLQLGTPDAPTAAGLRPYLKQFLADPRVIETKPAVRNYLTPGLSRVARKAPPQFLWDIILNGVIVPFRSPRASSALRRRFSTTCRTRGSARGTVSSSVAIVSSNARFSGEIPLQNKRSITGKASARFVFPVSSRAGRA